MEGRHASFEVQEPSAKMPGESRPRLHFLDWLRLLMVAAVVFAHIMRSGIPGGIFDQWMLDDRTLLDHDSYRAAQTSNALCSPLAVRYVSVVRQWCLPLLFWVSGAALACSYKGGMPRGLERLVAVTFVGMACNALIWFLGPLDDSCYVGKEECKDKGILFNFTIVFDAGQTFAILYQMWYTLVLVIITLLNWPLLEVSHGSAAQPGLKLVIQFALNAGLYCIFIFGSGYQPWRNATLVLALEAAFLLLVGLVSPAWEDRRPPWLSVRAAHYLLAAVALLQFGAIPYAEYIYYIGSSYIAYIVIGFNRFFNLGFLMTHSRLRPEGDLVKPLMSRVWPLMLLVMVICSPSTNWDEAGMLTYPYFRHAVDRILYVAGALVLVFVLDRCSRLVECDALPATVGVWSLLLYLVHPMLVTIFLQLGVRSVETVWVLSVLTVAAPFELPNRLRGALPRDGNVSRTGRPSFSLADQS